MSSRWIMGKNSFIATRCKFLLRSLMDCISSVGGSAEKLAGMTVGVLSSRVLPLYELKLKAIHRVSQKNGTMNQ